MATVSWQYDQDPRYGWVSIDTERDRGSSTLIIVDNYGFTYKDGTMTPTCICSAWNESECSCGLY